MVDRASANTRRAFAEEAGGARAGGDLGQSFANSDFQRMMARAGQAADFLKSLGHTQRLLILCYLAEGEKSVGELGRLLGSRQAALSQQLARLRHDALVSTRRDGKAIYYSLGNERSKAMIGLLYKLFCEEGRSS